MKIDLLKKDDLTSSIQENISKLFQQLGGDMPQISLDDVLDEKNHISLAYCIENDEILGIASMCTYHVISGKKGWIEDVVVNESARGKGIGRKLVNKLIETGKEKNLSQILLFTEDHRKSAIRLYSDVGFKFKDSKIYTFDLL